MSPLGFFFRMGMYLSRGNKLIIFSSNKLGMIKGRAKGNAERFLRISCFTMTSTLLIKQVIKSSRESGTDFEGPWVDSSLASLHVILRNLGVASAIFTFDE